jgi:hypothetical protein
MKKILQVLNVIIYLYATNFLYVSTIGRKFPFLELNVEPIIERFIYIVGALTVIQGLKLFKKGAD